MTLVADVDHDTDANEALCDGMMHHGGVVLYFGSWYRIDSVAPIEGKGCSRWYLTPIKIAGAA